MQFGVVDLFTPSPSSKQASQQWVCLLLLYSPSKVFISCDLDKGLYLKAYLIIIIIIKPNRTSEDSCMDNNTLGGRTQKENFILAPFLQPRSNFGLRLHRGNRRRRHGRPPTPEAATECGPRSA